MNRPMLNGSSSSSITSDRSYRKGLAFDAACAEILAQSGSQFDLMAQDVFVAEETALRGMVELKCGTAHADMLRTGHAPNAQSAHPLGSDQ